MYIINTKNYQMKSFTILLFFIIFQINAFGQNSSENSLINAFIQYKNADKYKDSIGFNHNLLKLNVAIENVLKSDSILNFQRFIKVTDSLNVNYTVKKSEDRDLLLFTMSDNMFHWNYIVYNNTVILKNHKSHEYFTEVHNLSKNEFLLIEQKDDLVFSCNYAYVFLKNGAVFKKKKAFGNKNQLTVCNFTEIDNSTPEKPDHFSLPVKKISFDNKNKIISYGSCTNSMTGNTTIGKAKYINGNFKIIDCDERKDFN
jgi:glutaredoxin-related protein